MPKLESWLRREALLGVLVVLCVALLAATAGTLAPTPLGPERAGSAVPVAAEPGPQPQPLSALGYHVSLHVTPLRFGTNSFTVTVTDAQRKPVTDAAVQVLLENLDTNLGAALVHLKPVDTGRSGVYVGRADFTAAGHWLVEVQATPSHSIPVRVVFHVTVGAAL